MQAEVVRRINNQVRASGAFTWQYGGCQCFLILRPLGEHPDQLQPPFPFALVSSRACRFIDTANYNFLLLYASFPTMRAVMPGKMTTTAIGECWFLLSHPRKKIQGAVFTQQSNRFGWAEKTTTNPFDESLDGGWQVIVQVLYWSFVFTPPWQHLGSCKVLLLLQR